MPRHQAGLVAMKQSRTRKQRLPLSLVAAAALVAGGATAADKGAGGRLTDSLEVDAYHRLIQGIEGRQGAYAEGLAEQLLSLGQALQREGRHEEAVEVFKRGTHVARINDGLYSSQQIPLVRGQIASHIALGQLEQADERQHYLYRVEIRSLERGEARAQALMQQARWQYDAYRLGLGEQDYHRLMSMWDLYRLALSDIADREAEPSPELLPPLYGMLKAQYLIAGYDLDSSAAYESETDYMSRQQYNRFAAYRAQSFDKGNAVLRAIYEVQELSETPDGSLGTAKALAEIGDWHLWHGERDQAMAAYGEALAELVERDDAQDQIAALFGEPRALPAIEGVSRLPPAAAEPGENVVSLQFGVTARGQVVDIDRLDDNEALDGKANRLMRKLRKTVFRPRFQDGEPVDTEQVVRNYAFTE